MTALSKRSNRFSETSIDDEVVVMRLDSGEFFSLSGTGAAIWRLIDGTRDRKALLASLAAAYQASEAEMAADVDDFIAQLKEFGLIDAA